MADSLRHKLSYVAESTRGTTPATPTLNVLRNTGVTLGMSKTLVATEEARSDRQRLLPKHGNKQVGGDISGELTYGTYDDFLEAVLGGTWTGDVLKAGTTRRYFSMLREYEDLPSDNFHLYDSCELNTFNMSVAPDAIVNVSFGIIGSGLNIGSAEPASSSYNAANTNRPFDSFSGVIQEGGSPIAVVTSLEMSLNNNLQPLFVVGSDTSIKPSIGSSDVSGTITVYFEDGSLLDKFISETASSLYFSLVQDGNTLEFTIPKLIYTGGQPDTASSGPITLTMPFTAGYDETEDTNLKIERTDA